LSDDLALLERRVELLEALKARGYRFITPTPATHARVLARRHEAKDLRDVLGWSMPFAEGVVDADIVASLHAIGAIETAGELLKSRLRVSSLGDDLFLHSPFPTLAHDAVFFGPDSYRFAAFIAAELPALGARTHLIDVGAGSGVGGVAAARTLERRGEIATVTLTDINPAAIELAKANILATGMAGGFGFLSTSGLGDVSPDPDCVIANPPYIVDPAHRAYRDGGGMHGGEISLTWAREAAQRLKSGGALLLYAGSAIVGGEDKLKAALCEALDGFDINYRELDPDVFGEELEREDYADVERIAVVGLVAIKR
jgi:methylase of polypeptide subunit release factors